MTLLLQLPCSVIRHADIEGVRDAGGGVRRPNSDCVGFKSTQKLSAKGGDIQLI
jgi:hypothetical protein